METNRPFINTVKEWAWTAAHKINDTAHELKDFVTEDAGPALLMLPEDPSTSEFRLFDPEYPRDVFLPSYSDQSRQTGP